ncbi:hypothetical protein HJD18_00745 [Thermoleophilia bacterium SCSIO 60948]|nr:hypothetical protein HJD18_00745 [Thermoleophilia bacterium SCSIO 60948]
MKRRLGRLGIALASTVGAVALIGEEARAGHGLMDHPAPAFETPEPPSAAFNAGGKKARWKMLGTVATGNPHTDLDFFRRGGETFASVGTLDTGANGGGQTIVSLGRPGAIEPELVSAHPSASCLTDPAASLGLQHDVEATPKSGGLLNARNPFAERAPTELLVDASDAPGRCHDQGVSGLSAAPQGGLEIVDVTDVENPVEIALTSHTGEAHTVNVDPKRPHIAYVSTSDAVGVDEASGERTNEDPESSDRFDLDGFEVVDMSSCMGFAPGASVMQKRMRCRPEVYRYRFPTKQMALGHTLQTGSGAVYGCHELEVYASDLLTCGAGNAMVALDMRRAFDDNGTPRDFTDDVPRGQPLPCTRRSTTSLPPVGTEAKVVDCVDGTRSGNDDLTVARWLDRGRESLRGARWLGSVHHQGRGAGGAATPAFDSTQDIDFDHEAELTASGRYVLATDERGGGVTPPGASCSPGEDVAIGNGGIHAYRTDRLTKKGPRTAKKSFRAYARAPKGGKAIFRVPVRTQPQASLCTAHVFQQIPGQNRIFMGWYSQGTQVVDFRERRDGTIKFRNSGYLIPESANTWVSHIFDMKRRKNGRITYFGATGDFNLGAAGRSAIDVYRVTLPAPPKPARPFRSDCRGGRGALLHDRAGRPFGSKAACLRAAVRPKRPRRG